MEKTAKGLENMIGKKDPEKDNDLIQMLQKLYSTTLDIIENKKLELEKLYNKKVDMDNN